MTIKRQLYISNILMVAVPILVSVVILIAGGFIALKFMMHNNDSFSSQIHFLNFKDELQQKSEGLLSENNPAKRIKKTQEVEKLLEQNDTQLSIYHGTEFVLQLGNIGDGRSKELIKLLQQMGGEGTISVGGTELVCENITAAGREYSLYLIGPQITVEYETFMNLGEILVVVLLLLIITVVFFTCRYLARSILKKIEKPLDILIAGVGEIRDGNLDHRISYEGKDEFAPICRDFNEMAQRLKDSVQDTQRHEQSRKELLAGISHDLRTPLTSISAYLDGILDGVANTPEKQKQYIETIRRKSSEISNMVEQLFLFSKLDLGEYPFYPEILNVGKMLEDMIQRNKSEYWDKGLVLIAGLIEEDIVVYADPNQLLNIFSNIMDNSLKYKTKNLGRLTILATRIDGDIAISLQDDGPGVPEQDIPKLFDTFYRCDPSRKNPGGGSGLGLAICAKRMERMNGRLIAESGENEGLCITVILPEYQEG